ncbi:hypothetical protein COJ48_15095 [Bacillus cereus]|uniref:DUF3899 domain-containing protein n=1 Tax=Bacillus paramycoides TaxID=2026194 RepID=A0A1J9U8Y8_9BACI|nr:hypothetical protein [Bacillus paramycoides]MED0965405.1 hypothetical protein [Bacillus paramycoides]OJD73242.1 hypothetical protein BAU28_18725 [Bacillus paramycoides]PFM63694.1 hypothetical protein COJ48_15095 [Bacillus cereus]PGP77224.1 hypothetical protein CN997_22640 [Bacillus cereus]
MKKGLGLLVTIIIEAGIVYVLSKILRWSFIDLTFFTGICFVIITYYFSSKGGFSSNSVRLQAQARFGIKVEEEKFELSVNPILIGSIVYTILSLILVVISYWSYFTK